MSNCNYCAEPYPLSQLDEHGACPNCRRYAPAKKPVNSSNQADDIMFSRQLSLSRPEDAPRTLQGKLRQPYARPEPKLRNVSGNLTLDGKEYEVVGQLTLLPLDD